MGRGRVHGAGLHPTALELLAERRIGVLGSDGNSDTAPSVVEGVDFPVHVLAINAMGLHLLDYLDFEDLVALCVGNCAAGRSSSVLAPLRLPLGTGSPDQSDRHLLRHSLAERGGAGRRAPGPAPPPTA